MFNEWANESRRIREQEREMDLEIAASHSHSHEKNTEKDWVATSGMTYNIEKGDN